MRSTDSERPYSADEVLGTPQIPLPRTPLTPTGGPQNEVSEDGETNSVARARAREAAARNTAAAELFEAGRYDEAVPLFEQAFAGCRSTFGGDHPDTMTVAGNLGVAYMAAGNRRRGLKLIIDNVEARTRVLGDSHPRTLIARNALAAAHRIAGNADKAVALAKQVVIQRSRLLGSTHTDTLSSRMGLALALAAAGEVSSAHRMLASTVNDAEEILGPEHPHTLVLLECAESNGLLGREF